MSWFSGYVSRVRIALICTILGQCAVANSNELELVFPTNTNESGERIIDFNNSALLTRKGREIFVRSLKNFKVTRSMRAPQFDDISFSYDDDYKGFLIPFETRGRNFSAPWKIKRIEGDGKEDIYPGYFQSLPLLASDGTIVVAETINATMLYQNENSVRLIRPDGTEASILLSPNEFMYMPVQIANDSKQLVLFVEFLELDKERNVLRNEWFARIVDLTTKKVVHSFTDKDMGRPISATRLNGGSWIVRYWNGVAKYDELGKKEALPLVEKDLWVIDKDRKGIAYGNSGGTFRFEDMAAKTLELGALDRSNGIRFFYKSKSNFFSILVGKELRIFGIENGSSKQIDLGNLAIRDLVVPEQGKYLLLFTVDDQIFRLGLGD